MPKAEDRAAEVSAAPPKEKAPDLYVDGKKVSEEVYLDAAEKAGWVRADLELHPERRPVSISTKKHGE